MVLATRSKKSNFLVKFICILLSVACVAGSAYFVENIVGACHSYDITFDDFNGSPMQKEVKDSNKVSERIYNDIVYANNMLALNDTKTLQKNLEKYRESFVSAMVKNYLEAQNSYFELEREEGDYSEEEKYFTDSYTLNYDAGAANFDFDLTVSLDDQIAYDSYDAVAVTLKFNEIYDAFVNSNDFKERANFYPDNISHDASMYAVNSKSGVNYNSEEATPDEKTVLSHKYSCVVKNGIITCGEGLTGFFDKSEGVEFERFRSDCDYYFYVKDDKEVFNSYAADIDAAERTKNTNLLTCAIWGAILLALAVVFAVISLVICGNRDKDGKLKPAFIDRMPTDLHLVLTAGAQVGLCLLFAFLYEVIIGFAYPFEKWLYISIYAVCALIWALFIEFMTSFVRVCKSDRKLYQNTLIYIIYKHIIKKPCKYIFGKLKDFFTFKPANFDKLLHRVVISYAALNAFFVLIILGCRAGNSAGGACFFFAVSIAVNITLFVHAVKYLKNLDAIITAAHFRQVPQVDYNKLPNSLKLLVNSLNYTQAELQNAVEQAVKDERMRTELITNVSHDLKTPLTSIITYVDLLKGCNIEDENAKEYISVLDDKGKKLKRLIEDLVEASKITSGVINIQPINLNLGELATQAVVEHQQEFADCGLSFVFKGDQRTVFAFADGNKTYRVIENLISNARKYSLTGTRVYADVYETQNFSIFEIKNTSAEPLDIPVEELKERFVRGDKSRTNEGNGLGLSIADNLCRAQNGFLNITIDGDLFKAQVMLPKAQN
ncbi:MAG: HAMP domain-containing histidine kinase [Eubacterium sp.]|nr:HAMP domain-containing histidine kinase [Eubacterium sp.]